MAMWAHSPGRSGRVSSSSTNGRQPRPNTNPSRRRHAQPPMSAVLLGSQHGSNPDDISLHVNACALMGHCTPSYVPDTARTNRRNRPKTNPSRRRPARKRIGDRDPQAARAAAAGFADSSGTGRDRC